MAPLQGTTNTHETQVLSHRAILYSDQSVLERHHLASAFTLMQSDGVNILASLAPADFREVRALTVELVLATDLSKHFEFCSRLSSLAATHGHEVLSRAHGHATGLATPSAGDTDRKMGLARSMTRRLTVGQPTLTRRLSSTPGWGLSNPLDWKWESPGVANEGGWKWESPFLDERATDVSLLLATAIKFADLGHSWKPTIAHEAWTERVTAEFYALGDVERALGVPISPLCDRERDVNLPKSQLGFFQFICVPFFQVVSDLIDPTMVPFQQLKANQAKWKQEQDLMDGEGQAPPPGDHGPPPPTTALGPCEA